MKKFLTGMALAAALLVLTATAQAAGQKGAGSGGRRGSNGESGMHNDYHTRFGTKFSHGYFYSGREHSHWTYRYHWAQYGCDCYWCPSTSCWYYFCETRNAYLPVSCIDQSPPAPAAAAAAAAAASSSNAVVAPTVVTNIIGSAPTVAPAPQLSDLPPLLPPAAPSNVKNTSIGSVGTVQPIGSSVPLLPGR